MISRMRNRAVGEIYGTWWNAVKGVLTPLTFVLCLACVFLRDEITNHTMRKALYTFSMQFISVQTVSLISVLLCILNISYSPIHSSKRKTGYAIWKYMKTYIYGSFPWILSLILYSFGVPYLIDMDIPLIFKLSETMLEKQTMLVTSVVMYYVTFIMISTFLTSLRPVIGFDKNSRMQFLRNIMFPDGDIKVRDIMYDITFDICSSTDLDGNFYDKDSGMWKYPLSECITDTIYGTVIVCTKKVAEDVISIAKRLDVYSPMLRKRFVIIPTEDVRLKRHIVTAFVKGIITDCSRIVLLGDIDRFLNSPDHEFILESCDSAYLYFTEEKDSDDDVINLDELDEPDGYVDLMDIVEDYFDVVNKEHQSTEYTLDINNVVVKKKGSTFCAIVRKTPMRDV